MISVEEALRNTFLHFFKIKYYHDQGLRTSISTGGISYGVSQARTLNYWLQKGPFNSQEIEVVKNMAVLRTQFDLWSQEESFEVPFTVKGRVQLLEEMGEGGVCAPHSTSLGSMLDTFLLVPDWGRGQCWGKVLDFLPKSSYQLSSDDICLLDSE